MFPVSTTCVASLIAISFLITACDKPEGRSDPKFDSQMEKRASAIAAKPTPPIGTEVIPLEAFRKIAMSVRNRYSNRARPLDIPVDQWVELSITIPMEKISVKATDDLATPYVGQVRGIVALDMKDVPGVTQLSGIGFYHVTWPYGFQNGRWISTGRMDVQPSNEVAKKADLSDIVRAQLAKWDYLHATEK